MINSSDQKCFIYVGLKKISLNVLDSKKNFLYTKEILIKDLSIEENFQTLEKFLNQNVLEVEKSLKKFINEIFIIVNYNKIWIQRM